MYSERKSSRPDFDRRHKSNKTVHSICLHCCATVATAASEAEIDAKEAQHVCSKRGEKKEKMMRQQPSIQGTMQTNLA